MSQSVDSFKSQFDLVANRIIGVNYQMFTWLFQENYLKEKSYQPFSDNQKENVNTLFLLFLQFKRKTHCLTWIAQRMEKNTM